MARLVVLILCMVGGASVNAQPVNIEVMLGKENFFYQHTLAKSLGSSRFGFFHTSSLHAFYTSDNLNEAMSQSYVTYRLTDYTRLAVGTFYAIKPGISVAAALQCAYAYRNFRASLVPRIDIERGGSVEMMMLLEYCPAITERITLYSRAQFMTNYGPNHHNRSYQNFRTGLRVKKTVAGVALNIDERGSEITTLHNLGVFLRYELN